MTNDEFDYKIDTTNPAWRSPPTACSPDSLVKLPGYTILVTQNGYQWTGLSVMNTDELCEFSDWLSEYVSEIR